MFIQVSSARAPCKLSWNVWSLQKLETKDITLRILLHKRQPTQRLEGRCIKRYATSESLRPNPKSVWPHNFFQPLNSLFAAWTPENYCGHWFKYARSLHLRCCSHQGPLVFICINITFIDGKLWKESAIVLVRAGSGKRGTQCSFVVSALSPTALLRGHQPLRGTQSKTCNTI